MELADKKCSDGGSVPPLKVLRARELLKELGQGWKLNGRGHLVRFYTFKDFAQSLAFANKVGAVAEAEGHHPDLHLLPCLPRRSIELITRRQVLADLSR